MHTSKLTLGYFHGENIFISITMDISMAHGKMPGDCTVRVDIPFLSLYKYHNPSASKGFRPLAPERGGRRGLSAP